MLRLAFAQLAEELKPRDEPMEMDTGERPGKQHRRVHSADGTTAVATAVATRARRDRGTRGRETMRVRHAQDAHR